MSERTIKSVKREVTPEEAKLFAVQNFLRDRAIASGVSDGHVLGFISVTAAKHVDELTGLINQLADLESVETTGLSNLDLVNTRLSINNIFSAELVTSEGYSTEKRGVIKQSYMQMFPPGVLIIHLGNR